MFSKFSLIFTFSTPRGGGGIRSHTRKGGQFPPKMAREMKTGPIQKTFFSAARYPLDIGHPDKQNWALYIIRSSLFLQPQFRKSSQPAVSERWLCELNTNTHT